MVRASWVLSALLTFVPVLAHAQSATDEQARQLYAEGDRHYNEGRYELAVQAFQRAYQLSGRPLLLFNLANAYERLGRYADALESLRGYAPSAPPNEAAQVQARIASLEQRAAEFGQSPGEGGSSADESLLVPGIVLTAAGGALGIGGIVMAVLALDAHAAAQAACAEVGGQTFCEAGARDAVDNEALYALLADLGMSIGGAAVLAGLVLIIAAYAGGGGGGEGEAAAPVAVLPYAAPIAGGGQVGAIVSF
jgi:tetratricopeptide (TPR) repeat protein